MTRRDETNAETARTARGRRRSTRGRAWCRAGGDPGLAAGRGPGPARRPRRSAPPPSRRSPSGSSSTPSIAGSAALDAELDALDGRRTESAFLFPEWSAWLASVPDAPTLLDELAPDPRRPFLGATPAMTPETAQRIVDVIAANGGRVGDGDTFVHAAGLSDDDVFDLDHTARTRLDPLVDGHVIGVLLPMRLETRYQPRRRW